MNKIKYSFYIGIVGIIMSCVSLVLEFFGVIDIMPVIIEIVASVSAILVAIGIVGNDSGKKDIEQIKEDIKDDIDKK